MAFSALGFAAVTMSKPIHERSHGCTPLAAPPPPLLRHARGSFSAYACEPAYFSLAQAAWIVTRFCAADCTMFIVTIAATAYYAMAAWGGSAPITSYTTGVTRPIYW